MSETELQFERFWSVKPRRKGDNSKKEAKLKFTRLVAKGHDPEKIIGAAKQWCEAAKKEGKENSEYIPMATTWLNQERFDDYQVAKVESVPERIFSLGKWWVWNNDKWAPEST